MQDLRIAVLGKAHQYNEREPELSAETSALAHKLHEIENEYRAALDKIWLAKREAEKIRKACKRKASDLRAGDKVRIGGHILTVSYLAEGCVWFGNGHARAFSEIDKDQYITIES